MKKIVLSFCMIVVVTMLFASCTSNKYGKGQTMSLEFTTNPTTGYDWEYAFLDGDGEVYLDKEDYQANKEKRLVGAAGKRLYYFKAKKVGKKSIGFMYRRPWEEKPANYDVIYELKVDKNLNIICLKIKQGNGETDKIDTYPTPSFTE